MLKSASHRPQPLDSFHTFEHETIEKKPSKSIEEATNYVFSSSQCDVLVSRLHPEPATREVRRKQDIVGLDVSMKDASHVEVVNCFKELSAQLSPEGHL